VVNATDLFYNAGGNFQETSSGVSIVEIDGTAHCRDMFAPNVFVPLGIEDTEAVQWGHAAIAAIVAAYLS
jgi:hypothetical protein